jgi:hypothetical protein
MGGKPEPLRLRRRIAAVGDDGGVIEVWGWQSAQVCRV